MSLPLGTLVEDPTTLSESRTPLMKRMCGRCQLVLGWKVCEPEDAGKITHGICAGCSDIVLEELDELLGRQAMASSLCAPGACLDRSPVASSVKSEAAGLQPGDTKHADGGRILSNTRA